MKGPTARSLSAIFSEFTGLAVSCTEKPRFKSPGTRRVYGIYSDPATYGTILLRADLSLVASMASSHAGFDTSLLADRLKASPLDAILREAIQQFLSKAATVVSNSPKVALRSVCMDTAYLTGPARSILNFPSAESSFDISFEDRNAGYTRGQLTIFSEA